MTKLLRTAGIYFALQAVCVALWWALLLVRPEYRPLFQVTPDAELSLLSFWLPDLLLLAGGSAVASFCCLRGNGFALPALWLVAGSVGYATLYSLAGSLMSDGGWMSIVLMAPSMLISVVLAVALTPSAGRLIRQARPAGTSWNVAKTMIHVVLFTGTFMFGLPALLVELQRRAGIPLVTFPSQQPAGALLFLLFLATALWSGITMSRLGEGTLLPVDGPRRLVVRGPYAYVRNPMAISGIGQGVAIAICSGSVLVLAYIAIGGLIWQFVARPIEEEDLAGHFGDAYREYRREVKCWRPRRTPFRPTPLRPSASGAEADGRGA